MISTNRNVPIPVKIAKNGTYRDMGRRNTGMLRKSVAQWGAMGRGGKNSGGQWKDSSPARNNVNG
jgi:hypothetical protein